MLCLWQIHIWNDVQLLISMLRIIFFSKFGIVWLKARPRICLTIFSFELLFLKLVLHVALNITQICLYTCVFVCMRERGRWWNTQKSDEPNSAQYVYSKWAYLTRLRFELSTANEGNWSRYSRLSCNIL